MKKLILGVTVGGGSKLLEGQAAYFKTLGYDVYLMSPNHPKEVSFCLRENCTHLPIKIERDISPLNDVFTIFQILMHFIKVKPDVVNFGTPKIGLLGTFSAWLFRVKDRVYTCRGYRHETLSGFKKYLMMFLEKFTCRLANKVIYVSPSLLAKGLEENLAYPSKSFTIGQGGSNGVNLSFFNIDAVDMSKHEELFKGRDIEGKFVIGFVGRITEDKGVYELIDVINRLSIEYPNIRLLLLGHFECSDDFKALVLSNKKIMHFPFSNDVPLYLSVMTIFVLPSWREGFPNVPIQAAAMGLPVVTTNATGCVDSVKDGFNGFIYPVKSRKGLEQSIRKYLINPSLVLEHSKNSIHWAKNFSPTKIWNGINEIYLK